MNCLTRTKDQLESNFFHTFYFYKRTNTTATISFYVVRKCLHWPRLVYFSKGLIHMWRLLKKLKIPTPHPSPISATIWFCSDDPIPLPWSTMEVHHPSPPQIMMPRIFHISEINIIIQSLFSLIKSIVFNKSHKYSKTDKKASKRYPNLLSWKASLSPVSPS